jgi:hypothetical protein
MDNKREEIVKYHLSMGQEISEVELNEILNKKEYIICAANHYDDGEKQIHGPKNIESGFVICGRRHHNCISIFAKMVGFPYDENGLKLMNTEEQGFLTNTDRFVSREEAAEIAFAAGQIKEQTTRLFSEDLY